jgi:CRP-like cAMP-binding protein
MPDHTNTAPLRRMLALRQFSPLAGIELAELATLADNVRETVFGVGHQIVARGARVPALHLVIDGCIEAEGRAWGPHEVFGLLEVLSSRPAVATAHIPVETRTFQIAAEDAREVLEDNFGMLHALVRELAGRLVAIDARPTSATRVPAAEGMTLVERLIALRRHVPFAQGRLQALAALARTFEPRRWAAGEIVVQATAPADSVIMVLEGELATIGDRVPKVVGPGGAIGILETLAGTRHVAAVEATAPTWGLCCASSAIVDVLEDHADLALSIAGALAGLLLDAAVPQAN